MADIAALTDVDVAPGQLQRGIGAHALDILDGVFQPEQRGDLHDPAHRHHKKGKDGQQRDVLLKNGVFVENCHWSGPPYSAGTAAGVAFKAGTLLTVIQRL